MKPDSKIDNSSRLWVKRLWVGETQPNKSIAVDYGEKANFLEAAAKN